MSADLPLHPRWPDANAFIRWVRDTDHAQVFLVDGEAHAALLADLDAAWALLRSERCPNALREFYDRERAARLVAARLVTRGNVARLFGPQGRLPAHLRRVA